MNFTMKGMLAIDNADIEIDGITIIAGHNQAGKSSLLNTVAAVMTGDKKLYGATQKDSSAVIRKGAKVGSARLTAAVGAVGDVPDWSTSLIFPKCEHMENGERPPHNAVTMGTVDPLVDFDAKEWSGFVRAVSGAGMIGAGAIVEKLDPDQTNPIAKEVMGLLQQGWDVATKVCEDRRLEARRAWEKATGGKFGAAKAKDWTPDENFDADDTFEFLQSKEAELVKELARAAVLKELEAGDGVDIRKAVQAQGQQANDLTAELEPINAEVARIQHELSMYPGSAPLECPKCKEKLEYKSQILSVFKGGSFVYGSDEHKALRAKLDQLVKDRDELAARKGSIVANMQANQSVLKRMDQVDMGKAVRSEGEVKQALDDVRARTKALMQVDRADDAYKQWKLWDDAAQVVGPNGVRMTATIKALKELNPRLQAMARVIFPGHEVILKHDDASNRVALSFDDMPYEALSWNNDPNSFALRIKIIFQLLEAQRLGNGAFIIIDRFDTLQKSHKNGVFKAMISSGITALIAQTMNDKPERDALRASGHGRMYWIDDGDVVDV